MKKISIFLLIISLTCGISAQDSLQYLASTSGAACQEVTWYDDYLYAGAGSTLMVYDVGQGSTVPYEKVFEYRYLSAICDIAFHNGYMYVAANHDGITKWDISNPEHPEIVCEYLPDNLDERAYDIAFRGDSLIVAYHKKVAIFRDNGSSFELLDTFANLTGAGYIRGGEVKDTVYAYVIGTGDAIDGVYIVNINTLAQISFVPQTYCDPEDVLFSENHDLMHVLGGTHTMENPLDPTGLYYVLDITDIANPVKVFEDTITGFAGLAIVNVMNAAMQNDTIYLATSCGLDPDYQWPDPGYGYVFIYDASNPDSIHFLNNIIAGLWHFDVSLHEKTLYIASEWYGVKTVDVTDIYNTADLGNTLTGGWNEGSDVHGNTLIVANEGYGFKKFDISNPYNPVQVQENQDPGFCLRAKISEDGNYLYTLWSTYDNFRIFTLDSLNEIFSMGGENGNDRWVVNGTKIYASWKPLLGTKTLNVIDVADPYNAHLDTSITININEICVADNKLYLTNDAGLNVYNIADDSLQLLITVTPGFLQSFKAITAFSDTVYCFVVNKGLVRYLLQSDGANYTLYEDAVFPLPNGSPTFMANDHWGLYLGYRLYGLYSYDKTTIEQKSWYRTGLDYISPNIYGMRDLHCREGYIILVEYHSQTTLLTNNNNFLSAPVHCPARKDETAIINAYPNPTSGDFRLKPEVEGQVRIFDITGKQVFIFRNDDIISLSGLEPGMYIISADNYLPVRIVKKE
ncbi:MAG: T9SS type A sorting domain-containing protein [Bacteroidetes bacterium]|nr:T9SS type A sorting domain-containing protein [Bacteroidota bacterium]